MSQTRKPLKKIAALVLGFVLAGYGVVRLALALFMAQPAMEMLVLEGPALVLEVVLSGGAILLGGLLMLYGNRPPTGNHEGR